MFVSVVVVVAVAVVVVVLVFVRVFVLVFVVVEARDNQPFGGVPISDMTLHDRLQARAIFIAFQLCHRNTQQTADTFGVSRSGVPPTTVIVLVASL